MKTLARKAWNGFLAAVTSPTAIEKEKSLAILIAVRVLIAVGASDGLIRIVQSFA